MKNENESKKIAIYHDDLDGKCSAYILRKYYPNNNIHYIPYTYSDKLNLMCGENKGDFLYILDVCVDEKCLDSCKEYYEDRIVWIDHHISSKGLWDKNKKILGYRQDGIAACELTWKWFFPDEEIPKFIKMIADRDLWNFNFYGDDTIWFFEYFDTIHNKPKSVIWDFLYEDDKEKKTLNNFIEKGKFLRYSKLRYLSNIIDKSVYESEIDGHKCLVMNHSDYASSSDLLHLMLDRGYNVAICYRLRNIGDCIVVEYSIRSRNDVDCSKIAMKRGGGGHKYTSGWNMKCQLFNEDNDAFFVKCFKNQK